MPDKKNSAGITLPSVAVSWQAMVHWKLGSIQLEGWKQRDLVLFTKTVSVFAH